MEPYFSHSMHLWTKNLIPVEKINLGGFGISALLSLKGVKVDWDFLRACSRFWDVEAHVFRFGADMEELCPTFEEFCAILGSNPDSTLAVPVVKVGHFASFRRLLGLDEVSAGHMVKDGLVNLASVIAEFCDSRDLEDLERQRYRMRALVFCLTSTYLFTGPIGWGNIDIVELVFQMEEYRNVASLVLAETLLSLDRICRADVPWSASPILLQVGFSFLFLGLSHVYRFMTPLTWFRSFRFGLKTTCGWLLLLGGFLMPQSSTGIARLWLGTVQRRIGLFGSSTWSLRTCCGSAPGMASRIS